MNEERRFLAWRRRQVRNVHTSLDEAQNQANSKQVPVLRDGVISLIEWLVGWLVVVGGGINVDDGICVIVTPHT